MTNEAFTEAVIRMTPTLYRVARGQLIIEADQQDAVQEAIRNNGGRILIIVLAVIAIIIAVAVWHKVNPYSMPIWLQQTVIDVRRFFTHENSWVIYGPMTPVP